MACSTPSGAPAIKPEPEPDPLNNEVHGQRHLAPLLSALGLVADIYDLNIINLVRPTLEAEFGTFTYIQDACITGAALIGAVVGQVGFGLAADRLGRRVMFVSTATLVGLASLASAFLVPGIWWLPLWRFLLGMGIGGEYPLAAANTMENVVAKSSGWMLAAVFSSFAIGQVLGPVVVLLLASMSPSDSFVWRGCFAIGAAFALAIAMLRYALLNETASFRNTDSKNREDSMISALWAMRRCLAGTVVGWFLYDVVTYGLGLFSSTIFPAEPGVATAKVLLLLNLASTPGYFFPIFVATVLPMRQMMLLGLSGMIVTLLMLWRTFDPAIANTKNFMFILCWTLMRWSDTMGPGVATFTIPGQIYPTRIRATAHGMSAAAGKLGGFVGTMIFPFMENLVGLRCVFVFMAAVCCVLILCVILLTPLYDSSHLEEIARHDKDPCLAQQAAQAERMLFEHGGSKGESMPLAAAGARVS